MLKALAFYEIKAKKKKLRQKWRGETTKKLYKFLSLYIRFQGLAGCCTTFKLHNVECRNNNISREGGLDTKASAFMYREVTYTHHPLNSAPQKFLYKIIY